MVPDIYKVFMAPPIRAWIFSCSYLRCYGRCHINSMRVILHTWCQIQRTSSSIRHAICCPGHIQCNYSRGIQASIFSWSYLRCYWRYLENSMRVILQSWCLIQRTHSGLRYMNCVPGHIQCISSSIYSDFNIRLNVSALLFEIIGHYDARYTAKLERNIAHIIRFTLCGLWSRTYTM
jgi:hypothetical protein